jgi:hypothetical protein
VTSPYLDTEDAATYLRWVKPEMTVEQRARALRSFHEFVRRRKVPKFKVGGSLRFKLADIKSLVERVA